MVAVAEQPSTKQGTLRYELNRSLTGMGHERYVAGAEVTGTRPPDELARRIFETGQAARVHVYGNMVTVDLNAGSSGDGLDDVIRRMYQFWTPGKPLPSPEDLQAPDEGGTGAGGDAAAAAGAADNPALAAALARVPAALLERSRLGRERRAAKG